MRLHQFSIEWLPGLLPLVKAHQQAGQQLDNLCGTYWAAILLAAIGRNVTPAEIARLAGSTLPTGDPASWLPSGAVSRQDYGLTLPIAADPALAGTSVQGLDAAVLMASGGAYRFVPLQAQWTAERVFDLMDFCRDRSLVPLGNLRTDHLWGAGLGVADAIAYLNGETIAPPPPDWKVGHFLLAGTVTGAAQECSDRSLVLVCDTYPMFGWQGYYLQAAEAIAKALDRGDGYGGGVLLFVASKDYMTIAQAAIDRGFVVEFWDNGSPIPAGG
ncbi:hypothetical protein H6F67_22315 [Microcoleus sp. FACHB-1515]|uniref:DUF6885 family protein n=1 Tax=Cyanophyceae TaxID=3028117 RepID=UPI00168A340E|nr:hypothetical protein [Microcoleus sp. FACHB-1515]MBD2092587.1 hypothetical protein [Microcoleus sp. FACHB-1515]